jgi:hypothetical protein
MSTKINNLYQLLLQRLPEPEVLVDYPDMNQEDTIFSIRDSAEYRDITKKKYGSTIEPKRIDYTIIKINDRSNSILSHYQKGLGNSQRHMMEFFDCSKSDYKEFFSKRKIKICWDSSYSFYREEPLIGEFGICASQIIALEYMVKNKIPEMLVFEDDVILCENYTKFFAQCYNELPKDYDFLADNSVFPNERFVDNLTCNILYKDYISRTHLQNAHLGMMLFSLRGAKKILALLKKNGFFAPIDTMLFHYSRNEELNGFTTYYGNKLIEHKDVFGSMIDEHNIRR